MTSAREAVKLIERTLELDAKATKGPWRYRPVEYDDWGWLRAPGEFPDGGHCVAQARAGARVGNDQLNEHRRAKTDPYGSNAELIAHYRTAAPALARHLQAALSTIKKQDKALLFADANAVGSNLWPAPIRDAVKEARSRQEGK